MTDHWTFPLTSLRLRFNCQAETPLRLGGLRAGSNLRGALVGVMRRSTCAVSDIYPITSQAGKRAEGRRQSLSSEEISAHTAHCPVCWLVAANDHPGEERRGYVITPPLGFPESLQPSESFDFRITLFGDAARYLPYFVLAVPETGRIGIGVGHGRFALKSICAEHPLTGDWQVLKEGENLVKPPAEMVTHVAIEQSAEAFAARLGTGQLNLRIDFPTPLRLILGERLVKSPDFGVIFSHILKRLDDLAIQYAGGTVRPTEERQRLWNLANRVRLVESQVNWADVPSGSSRTGQPTWISGLVGTAWYSAPAEVWRELLPWLLWGEITQVGKDTAKGNGVFRIKADRG